MAEYIEREAALLSLTPIVKRASERNRNVYSAVKQCVEAINWCPAADVAPVRHGMWIRDGMTIPLDEDGCPESWCVCSECGDWLTASDEYAVRGHYCHNCGAKMDQSE